MKTRCPQDKCPCIVSPRVWRLVLGSRNSSSSSDSASASVKEKEEEKTRTTGGGGGSAPPPNTVTAAPLSRREALEKYERYLSSNYVDVNKFMKWCPSPTCGHAVFCNSGVREVQCDHCYARFCFRCGSEAHAPLSCQQLAKWLEKCSNESETVSRSTFLPSFLPSFLSVIRSRERETRRARDDVS